MTLRELIQSVDSEQYSESPLYQKLCETKPEYGSNDFILILQTLINLIIITIFDKMMPK